MLYSFFWVIPRNHPKERIQVLTFLLGELHFALCNFKFKAYPWLYHSGTLIDFSYLSKKYLRKVIVNQIRVACFCVTFVEKFSSRQLFG